MQSNRLDYVQHLLREMPESVELSAFAREIGVGRTTMFYLLKQAGWIDKTRPQPTGVAIRDRLLAWVPKNCRSPRFARSVFHTTHITRLGGATLFEELREMISAIPDEESKSRVITRFCRAGFADIVIKT